MKRLILLFSFALAVISCTSEVSNSIVDSINSPDGKFLLNFYISEQGEPLYSLSFKDQEVILASKLGLDIKHQGGVNDIRIFEEGGKLNSSDLRKGFVVEDIKKSSKDHTWNPVWGEVNEIRDNYNEMAVKLAQTIKKATDSTESIERYIVIRFRLFNDGLGFRYEFPKQNELNYFIIGQEKSEFIMGEDLIAFWIAGDYDANEYSYVTSKITDIPSIYPTFDRSGNSCTYPMPIPGIQTPVMMKSEKGDLYVNIHEAALNNYSSMQLEVKGTKFISHLVPDALGNRGYIQTPHNSPWRTIVVADNAPAILESKLILNLNEPCAIENTEWIKPQKFIGVWWEMFLPGFGTWAYSCDPNVKIGVTDFNKLKPTGRHAANTENVKKYIDFAAKNGIHGVLVEGWDIGWEDWIGQFKENVFDFTTPYPDFDVKGLREYAKGKGVQLVMHHETSGSASNYERYLDRAYQFMKDNNYSVVKSGYVGPIIPRGEHHYGQTMVNHYLHCIRRATDYQIMIDAHEPVRPTGMHRTYPNFLAAESGRGTEFETFFEQGNAPEHTTIMPFTRLMGGPMDYTPGIFEQKMSKYGDGTSKARIHTTLAKQLALYVVIYSPLQMVADLPQNYERFPDAFQFIKDVAVDWDYTKVLEAEPGDYITTARKSKGEDKWFIGGITDENPRVSIIDFSKIPISQDHEYTATIYADGEDAHWDNNPQSYKITTQSINSNTKLKIKLAAGGGFAISIE